MIPQVLVLKHPIFLKPSILLSCIFWWTYNEGRGQEGMSSSVGDCIKHKLPGLWQRDAVVI